MTKNPYYQDDTVTIYHGDCRDILPQLEPVDLVVMDWPFAMKIERSIEAISYLSAVSLPNANIAMINNPHNFFRLVPYLQSFTVRNGIVLPRTAAFFPAYHVGFQHNYIWLLTKGACKEATWNGNTDNHVPGMTDIWDDKHYTSGFFGHPQAIPRWLADRVVNLLSDRGQILLDVFTGTGTFLRSAKDLGRKAIGIEIEERYCEIAAKRMSQMVMELHAQVRAGG